MNSPPVLPPHELLAPATLEAIEAEERLLGWPLPASLKAFLLRHNGGWFYSTMVRFYSVGDVEYRFSEENADHRRYDDDWPDAHVLFATDGGIGYFFYDAAIRDADGDQPLFYWPQEERRAEPLGTTFDAFAQHLQSVARIRWRGRL